MIWWLPPEHCWAGAGRPFLSECRHRSQVRQGWVPGLGARADSGHVQRETSMASMVYKIIASCHPLYHLPSKFSSIISIRHYHHHHPLSVSYKYQALHHHWFHPLLSCAKNVATDFAADVVLTNLQGPLSCSDKMAQWSALGLGNLELSGGLRPLHLATCTVGYRGGKDEDLGSLMGMQHVIFFTYMIRDVN